MSKINGRFINLVLVMVILLTILPTTAMAQPINDASTFIELPGTLSSDLGTISNSSQNIQSTLKDEEEEISVFLTPKNETQLEALVTDVQDPRSPHFRKYLTQDQYNQQFGPDQKDFTLLKTYYTSQGLSVSIEDPNKLFIEFKGKRTQLDKVFNTKSEFREDKEGFKGYINISPIMIPSSLSKIVKSVVGFDHLHQARSSSGLMSKQEQTTTDPNTPEFLRSVYNITDSTFTGANTRVGIIMWQTPSTTDFKRWRDYYDPQIPDFNLVNIFSPAVPPTTGENVEIQLDLEMVTVAAPRAPINVYWSPNNYADLLAAINKAITDRVSSITNSWGSCSNKVPVATKKLYHDAFSRATLFGIPVIFASGDDGVYSCTSNTDSVDNAGFSQWPAEDDLVTALGGTKVGRSSNGTRTETGWSCSPSNLATCANASNGSSGGGISTYFSRPAYQANITVPNVNFNNPNLPSPAGKRVTPDISLIGDPSSGVIVYDNSCTTNCGPVGGTSAAAPLFAGIAALMVQKIGGPVGNLNPFIYDNYSNSNWSNDIIIGYNGSNSFASTGWDFVTGLGSIKDVNAFIGAFNSQPGGFIFSHWNFRDNANSFINIDQKFREDLRGDHSFWGFDFNFPQGSDAGYIGIKTDGLDINGLTHDMAVFSISSGISTSAGNSSGWCQNNTCQVPIVLKATEWYTLRIWSLNTDSIGHWWGAWLIASDGSETPIGAIAVPTENHDVIDHQDAFGIYFGPAQPCNQMSQSSFSVQPPAAEYDSNTFSYAYYSDFSDWFKGNCTGGMVTNITDHPMGPYLVYSQIILGGSFVSTNSEADLQNALNRAASSWGNTVIIDRSISSIVLTSPLVIPPNVKLIADCNNPVQIMGNNPLKNGGNNTFQGLNLTTKFSVTNTGNTFTCTTVKV